MARHLMTIDVSLSSEHGPASGKAFPTNVAEGARVDSQDLRTTGAIAMSKTLSPKPSLAYCVCGRSNPALAIMIQAARRRGTSPSDQPSQTQSP